MVLKAVILVGGYGTRLRPLTFSKPKPLVEFCNHPIVKHQIDALVAVGVKHIVMCVSFTQKALEEELAIYADKIGIQISFSVEETPMGTAGPLVLAKELLDMNDPDPFFMLNADVTSRYPFKDLLKYHQNHGKEGTILVTQVEDPTKYGVVVFDEQSGKIERFVEKPQAFVGDKINAGMYIFNKSIVNRIPNKPTSIERVIFPAMVADTQLCAMVLEGFWMDIGQPKDYLTGMCLKLDQLQQEQPEKLTKGPGIQGPVLMAPSAVVGEGSLIGPNVVLGPNVRVASGVRLQRCTIMGGVTVGQGAYVANSIVGWNSRVGDWARLQDSCVLGEDVNVPAGRFLRSTTVLPHKSAKTDNFSDDKIII